METITTIFERILYISIALPLIAILLSTIVSGYHTLKAWAFGEGERQDQ